jgi:integrase
MNINTGQGYGNYEPPKEEKRHPLTRQDTRKLYQTACQFPDVETELAVRVLLDYGLRVGELAHLRAHWVDTEYQQKTGSAVWRIRVPTVEYCFGGSGRVGKGNPDGTDLHTTGEPCSKCANRSWESKVAPEHQSKDGWITQEQADEYDYAPKTARSATKVWQFPGIEETADTAKKLKQFVKSKSHEQWPHSSGSIRNRIDKVVEQADLEFPDRSQPKLVPHGLRHTYGCRLVEMGVGEGAGMKQMRHQNADVFRWYSEVRGARVVTALDNAASESDSLIHE